ncbi:restriction endonuclease subunit S [Vibrio sp. MA64]|uniref:restriction endonuclease subunit S n=1 Tax=Vibrio sp. MA64 TaxID=2896365 RepID=UPI001E4258DA|nr:restriction endonuclease subunit S [Vibrio sp. MA64]MCC9651029.1 restriction endonuclease subunit S [Vibrio sp. MA64]
MVPNGWKVLPLSEITKEKISYGIVQAGPHVEAGIPYIKSADVGGDIDVQKLQRTAPEIHHKYRRSAVHPNDIVFSLRGNIARTSIVPSDLPEANLTQGTARISVDEQNDTKFVYYKLASTPILNRINALGKGSTFKEISLEELRKVKLPLPPLPEQRKIAKILSTWDKAISTTEKLIETSKQQKKALMQQLLTGKKRLVNPETGKAFEGEWTYKTINEVATRIQKKSDGEAHPILTISSLSGFVTQEDRYSRYMAGESVKNYILLKRGEFAYNKGNSKTYQFGCIFDLESFDTGLVPHVYVCFKLNTGLNHRYFKYLFEADYLKPQLGALVNTGVRNNGLLNIKPTEFMNTKVPVPCFGEQERIADVLHTSSENLKILNTKLAHLKQEKKALMQQLLTGKRRVKVDEDVAV